MPLGIFVISGHFYLIRGAKMGKIVISGDQNGRLTGLFVFTSIDQARSPTLWRI